MTKYILLCSLFFATSLTLLADEAITEAQEGRRLRIDGIEVPRRVQGIIEGTIAKGEPLYQYYPWHVVNRPDRHSISYFMLSVLFLSLSILMYFVFFSSNIRHSLGTRFLQFLCMLGSPCIGIYCGLEYYKIMLLFTHPGGVLFTHQGILFIPPGQGKRHEWILYKDIVSTDCKLKYSLLVADMTSTEDSKAEHLKHPLDLIFSEVMSIKLSSGQRIVLSEYGYRFITLSGTCTKVYRYDLAIRAIYDHVSVCVRHLSSKQEEG